MLCLWFPFQVGFHGVDLLAPCPAGFVFKIIVLQDWLPTNARYLILHGYLIRSLREGEKRWTHTSPKIFSAEVTEKRTRHANTAFRAIATALCARSHIS